MIIHGSCAHKCVWSIWWCQTKTKPHFTALTSRASPLFNIGNNSDDDDDDDDDADDDVTDDDDDADDDNDNDDDTHAVCPQPLREKLEQSRAASQESETYQINTDDDNYNVDGYEYNDV